MSKPSILKIDQNEIAILNQEGTDYFSLTGMTKGFAEAQNLISKWMSNKNTLEYLAIWERMNNQNFNYPEIEVIKKEAGNNRFIMSVGQWISRTNAKGLIVRAGKYGGTYAHKDIAFHFAMWLSPEFQLLMVKEYQILKEKETNVYRLEWDFRRFLTKANYRLHTDAVKQFIIPACELPENMQRVVYAEEADILNLAVFGCTAKDWRDANAIEQEHCDNIRDCADNVQLLVLANLESLNGTLMREGKSKSERFETLCREAKIQMQSMYNQYADITAIQSPNLIQFKNDTNIHSGFDQNLKGLLSVPPPNKK